MDSREAIDVNLQNLWLGIKRRWLPATGVFACIVGASVILASLQKPVYVAQGKILLRKVSHSTSITDIGSIDNSELEPLTQEGNPANTEIEIISSLPLANETIAALNLTNQEGERLKPTQFLSHLKLKNVPSTDVVEVIYESPTPQEAAAVVNKHMSLYVEKNISSNRAQASAVGDFIAKQLPKVETTLREAEAALRRFKEQNQVVNLEEEGKSAVAVLKELEDRITATAAALEQAKTRSVTLQREIGANPRDVRPLNTINQSASVQKVLEELQQVEGELVILQTRFYEGHPSVESLQNKKAALKSLLQNRIQQSLGVSRDVSRKDLQLGELKQKLTEEYINSEVERLSLASQLAFLSQARSNYRARSNILPQLEQRQGELERQVAVAQSTYELLLKKLQESRVEENRNIGNVSIIETALVPEQPAGSKKIITVGLGSVLAALLAVATILLLEISDKSIKTIKDAKQVFRYTLIAGIPHLGKKVRGRQKQDWPIPELPVRDNPRSLVAETYRMLQANLKFLSSDRALKAVVVTSSVPKEGKSTICANLATAIAQLGRRVLLVDADMRCPLQHHIWNLNNDAGLSNVIVSQIKLQEAVQEVMPNLNVLTAGVIPPNPMALLDSHRMASLMNHFTQQYDFVIIDAPPLGVAADAQTLGQMTDGILLVARLGVVDFASAAAAQESLDCSCQNVLGVVVNDVAVKNERYYKFHPTRRKQSDRDSTEVLSARR